MNGIVVHWILLWFGEGVCEFMQEIESFCAETPMSFEHDGDDGERGIFASLVLFS